jgi:hypothetical protein
MGSAVGDGNDVYFAVNVIAVFQNRTKRRRATRGLKNNRALFAPLVSWMLAVWDALNRPQIDIQSFLSEKALIVRNPHWG